mgnify:CR=1 FL=1
MPESTPCKRGIHHDCGCVDLAYQCCLDCTLVSCIYEGTYGRVPRISRQRGAEIRRRLISGQRPVQIQTQLGIDKTQYRRALRAIA